MRTRIQKWGNSQGLRLPKHVLEEASLHVGDVVEITVEDDTVIVSPVKKVRGKYRLETLVKKIPEGYHPKEVEWGKPEGKETW